MGNPVKPHTLEVALDNQSVELQKLPLRKYAELLNSLDKLPEYINVIDQESPEKIVTTLPKAIANCLPEVERILAMASPLSPDEIGKLAMDEVITLLKGIIEVNKYSEVYAEIKKLFARPTKKDEKKK